MWAIRSEELNAARGFRYSVDRDSRPATVAEVLDAWKSDPAFRGLFNSWLAASPFVAFRWETPPVTLATLSKPFEFVLLDSPGLARRADPGAFADQFQDSSDSSVVTFANLGGDATLVVPCPRADTLAYGHLAAFVREAPATQRDSLWEAVGHAMARRMDGRSVWLSTAGAGVPWLHVRLDDRPKYYGHSPYRHGA